MTGRHRVSGHYAGAFSRLVAFLIDWLLIVVTYGVAATVFEYGIVPLFRLDVELATIDPGLLSLVFAGWAFLYIAVGLMVTGRTPGKAVLGLRVVTRRGTPIGTGAAIVRTLVLPLSLAFVGIGFIGVLLGRERRALHDVVAGTAVVYDWGDRPAELPAPVTHWLAKRGAFDDEVEARGEGLPASVDSG